MAKKAIIKSKVPQATKKPAAKAAQPGGGKATPKKSATAKAGNTPKPTQPSARKSTTKKSVDKAAVTTKKIGDIKGEETKTPKSKLPHTFNIDEITSLLSAVNHSGINELKLEKDDFKITIRQGVTGTATVVHSAAPVAAAPPMQPTSTPAAVSTPDKPAAPAADNTITVKSPMIGTFYRSASPDKPPLVSVGDTIKEGDVLCIVEAMKLFNEIESEVSGTVIKVLVDDTSPVEYDQPLFIVEP